MPGSQHVTHIRRAGRIREYCSLQGVCRKSLANREPEKIDHLVDIRTDKVSSEYLIGALFDHDLETVNAFSDASCALRTMSGSDLPDSATYMTSGRASAP